MKKEIVFLIIILIISGCENKIRCTEVSKTDYNMSDPVCYAGDRLSQNYNCYCHEQICTENSCQRETLDIGFDLR